MRYGARTVRVLVALALCTETACSSDGVSREPEILEQGQNNAFATGIKVLARSAPKVINALAEVPYTFEVAVVDTFGRYFRNATVVFGRSTGYVKALGAPDSEWQSSGDAVLVTGANGRVAFRWHTGADATARLLVDINGNSLPGAGRFIITTDTLVTRSVAGIPAPVGAEQVAPSGLHSVCFLRQNRVGCLGSVAVEDSSHWRVGSSLAVAEPRWLQFSSPPVEIRSITEGACALLASGFTSCWRSLGPVGEVLTSASHEPLRKFSGRLALSATGNVYQLTWGARPTDAPSWRAVRSDSVIVQLFANSGSLGCGFATSGAVMCVGFGSLRLARAFPGGEVLFADGGSVMAGSSALLSGSETVLISRVGAGERHFTGEIFQFSNAGTLSSAGRELDSISPGDGTVRSCAMELSNDCAGGAWKSYARFGSPGGIPTSRSPESQVYFRVCGIREVVVCSWVNRLQSRRGFDTLRVRSQ